MVAEEDEKNQRKNYEAEEEIIKGFHPISFLMTLMVFNARYDRQGEAMGRSKETCSSYYLSVSLGVSAKYTDFCLCYRRYCHPTPPPLTHMDILLSASHLTEGAKAPSV